jgi:AraC-like DNA-binding protein
MPELSYSFYESGGPLRGIERELPVEVVSTGHDIQSSAGYRWGNARHHRARYHVFQHTIAGRGFIEARRGSRARRYEAGPSSMFIASWDEDFEYYWDGGGDWEFRWIILSGDFADRTARALRAPRPVLSLPEGSGSLALLEELQARLASRPSLDRYELTCIGYEFLARLLRDTSKTRATTEARFIMEARDFVRRRIGSASVSALAEHFGYDEKYFSDFFKRRAGTTPNKFIVEERMRYAARLLVGTRKRVSEIAEDCGFSEDNYFSKVFKRSRGMSPSEYRERNQGRVPVEELVIL